MLTVSHITKKYHDVAILDNISFEIPRGAIAGIIGPNGAGKSTMLNIIAGFEESCRGEIFFEQKKLNTLRDKVAVFSYMPEHLELYPDWYVAEFIDFVQKTTHHKENELIEKLNLLSVKNKQIGHLSKGYKQRLKLFVALSNKRQFVVLDEPFDGFDPIQLAGMLEVIREEQKKERSFLISIHQLSDAEKICDYYILLNEGALVAQGNIAQLREKFGEETSSLETIFMAALQ